MNFELISAVAGADFGLDAEDTPGHRDRVQCLNTDTVPANLPATASSSRTLFHADHRSYITK